MTVEIIFGIIIAFALSLLSDAVRSFLFVLPSRILKRFRKKRFKRCKLLFKRDAREVKGLGGKYFSCTFEGNHFIISVDQFPRAKPLNSLPLPDKILFHAKTEGTEISQENDTTTSESDKFDLTNDQIRNFLDSFILHDKNKQIISLSDSLYSRIRIELQKRNISLEISAENFEFKKIPYCNLSERDFGCSDYKLSIENS